MTEPAFNNVTPLDTAKPSSSIVMVDPDMARRWLDRNNHNRNIRERHVDAFVRDMAAGQWRLTGEAVKFAKDGTLLDGQHRLRAIAKADVTVALHVVRGLDPESQRVMDTGAKRSAADDLGLQNEKNTSHLAATLRLAVAVRHVGINQANQHKVTNSEIAAFLEQHPEIRDAVAFAKDISREIDVFPAVVAYAYWHLALINKAQAQEFFTSAAEKVNLAEGDPVIAMTKRFAEARRARERLPHSVQLSVIYRAWNARRAGKTMRFIRIKSPGHGQDITIPEPK